MRIGEALAAGPASWAWMGPSRRQTPKEYGELPGGQADGFLNTDTHTHTDTRTRTHINTRTQTLRYAHSYANATILALSVSSLSIGLRYST